MMDKNTKLEALARRILLNCQNELYSLFPYMDGAFAGLPCRPGREADMGTDGGSLLFSPNRVAELYSSDPAALRRGYLHILLHCLFLQPFRNTEHRLWQLACDMAVEHMIERSGAPRLALPDNELRRSCFAVLGEKSHTAEQMIELIEQGAFPYAIADMEAAFRFDDHSLWAKAGCDGRDKWEKILSYTSQNAAGNSRRAGTAAGQKCETLGEIQKSPYDYRKFLHRFAVPREEMELDHDSFDYIFYDLGMELYGNLPLIEPLEYREGNKLEELVIAIDTSGSCSKETVQNFLAETYSILSRRENFFRKMRVYLIQCDCLVQSVAVIHSAEEWKNYSRAITIQGRGGTDFTPVFRYVAEQRRKGKLQKLKALLYFTDGDGFFSREKTDYETAFIFLEETDKMEAVPPWATKLLVR